MQTHLLARRSTQFSFVVIVSAAVLGGLAPLIASDRPYYMDTDRYFLGSPWLEGLGAWEAFGIFIAAAIVGFLFLRAFAIRGFLGPKVPLAGAALLLFAGGLAALVAANPKFETRRYHAEIEPRRQLLEIDGQYLQPMSTNPEPAFQALSKFKAQLPLLTTVSNAIEDRFEVLENEELDAGAKQLAFGLLRNDNEAELQKLDAAFFAPLPIDPDYPGFATLSSPSSNHFAGTDATGRDLLSRLIHGTRTSMGIALAATLLACGFGLLLGAIAGFAGGVIDWLLSRFIEAFLCLPALFLLVILGAYVPAQVEGRVVILTLFIAAVIWTMPARLVRAEVQKAKNSDYVRSARALGANFWRILFRHIIPNALTPLWVSASFILGAVILIEATLSFLGLGLHELPSWGQALRDARETTRLADTWHLAVFPGLAVFLVVFAFNQLGDALRDHLDPRR
ncbi:MAG: ABC transporter permease [Planctomycetota bacterium]